MGELFLGVEASLSVFSLPFSFQGGNRIGKPFLNWFSIYSSLPNIMKLPFTGTRLSGERLTCFSNPLSPKMVVFSLASLLNPQITRQLSAKKNRCLSVRNVRKPGAFLSRSPSSALLPFPFRGRIPPTKIDRKEIGHPYSNLSTGGPSFLCRRCANSSDTWRCGESCPPTSCGRSARRRST